MTVVFIVLGVLVVVATALALAGRWRPEGLGSSPPRTESPSSDERPRFDVVLRGYRMDQVDAELARLHQLLGEKASPEREPGDHGMRPMQDDTTIEP